MTVQVPKALLLSLLFVVLVAACGYGGFRYGQSTRDEAAAYTRGLTTGRAQGEAAGHGQGVKEGLRAGAIEFGPTSPAAARLHRAAYRRGKLAGVKEGISSGVSTGFKAGANSAFEGYGGGWAIGDWYAIRIGVGTGGQKYSIPSRVKMDLGQSYNICPDSNDNICGG